MTTIQERVLATSEAQWHMTVELAHAALAGMESMFMLQMSSARAMLSGSPVTIIAEAEATGETTSPLIPSPDQAS